MKSDRDLTSTHNYLLHSIFISRFLKDLVRYSNHIALLIFLTNTHHNHPRHNFTHSGKSHQPSQKMDAIYDAKVAARIRRIEIWRTEVASSLAALTPCTCSPKPSQTLAREKDDSPLQLSPSFLPSRSPSPTPSSLPSLVYSLSASYIGDPTTPTLTSFPRELPSRVHNSKPSNQHKESPAPKDKSPIKTCRYCGNALLLPQSTSRTTTPDESSQFCGTGCWNGVLDLKRKLTSHSSSTPRIAQKDSDKCYIKDDVEPKRAVFKTAMYTPDTPRQFSDESADASEGPVDVVMAAKKARLMRAEKLLERIQHQTDKPLQPEEKVVSKM